MPIYEYKCKECGRVFEVIVYEDINPVCTYCGSSNVEKIMSAPNLISSDGSSSALTRCGRERPCCGRSEPCSTPPCREN